MPGKPKQAAKKSSAISKDTAVDTDEDIDEMDADELAMIFPSSPFQITLSKFGEN